MTNKEAIKIVEYMIESINDIDVLYDYEKDALNKLIQTAKDWDEMIKEVHMLRQNWVDINDYGSSDNLYYVSDVNNGETNE